MSGTYLVTPKSLRLSEPESWKPIVVLLSSMLTPAPLKEACRINGFVTPCRVSVALHVGHARPRLRHLCRAEHHGRVARGVQPIGRTSARSSSLVLVVATELTGTLIETDMSAIGFFGVHGQRLPEALEKLPVIVW